ncbi:MAG: glycosyltransferase, partial [Phycisphaeraceae bacterium]
LGEAVHCHGDAMMRRVAFDEAGGFDDTMIAGEEPGLSYRLRQRGWKLERIDAEMTWHDADMTKFSQWWKRTIRSGHAYAELADKHGQPPERYCVDHVRSSIVWGLVAPAMTIVFAALSLLNLWFLSAVVLLMLLYVRQFLKITQWRRGEGDNGTDARRYAFFTVVSKLPLALGILKYVRTKRSGEQPRLIEYKSEGALKS